MPRSPARSCAGPRHGRVASMEVVYEFGVPDPITDLGGIIDLHIRRRDRPGGVFHEYLHGESSQRLGRHRWVVEQTFLLADRHPPITPPLRTPGRSPRFLHRFSQRLSSATADSPNEMASYVALPSVRRLLQQK
jgi:hypothetical protein